MTEQNFNPRTNLKSCLALSDAIDRFLNYLEEIFDLSPDQANWMLAGMMHSQPYLTESNPKVKEDLALMAQHVKSAFTYQSTHNEQN